MVEIKSRLDINNCSMVLFLEYRTLCGGAESRHLSNFVWLEFPLSPFWIQVHGYPTFALAILIATMTMSWIMGHGFWLRGRVRVRISISTCICLLGSCH